MVAACRRVPLLVIVAYAQVVRSVGASPPLSPLASDQGCEIAIPHPVVVTRPGSVVPMTGGVLIGWVLETKKKGDSTRATTSVREIAKTIAPGVEVIFPRDRTTAKKISFAIAGDQMTFARGGASTALPPPQATRAHRQIDQGRRNSTHVLVTVDLQAPAPPTAVGVIAYRSGRRDGVTALSYKPLSDAQAPTSLNVEIFETPTCAELPKGTQSAVLGEDISIAWVDEFGQVSARSPLIRVSE